jgi:hypothetical protein
MEFHLSGKTKYFKKGDAIKSPEFAEGDTLSVEASTEPDGSLAAANVYWEEAASATTTSSRDKNGDVVDTWKDKPAEPATVKSPPPAPADPDDPGPPKLRRGVPQAQARKTEPPPAEPPKEAPKETPKQVAVNLPPPTPGINLPEPTGIALPRAEPAEDQSPLGSHQEDALIRKASEAALEFTESLPNYVVQEFMTRSQSDTKPVSWHAMDVVAADVVYESGREDYRNIKVNGKAVNKPINEIGGSWSTGEFGTLLIDLFSPSTGAEFHYRGEGRIAGMTAKMYDFSVVRERSHWNVIMGPQQYSPAYSGTTWIDPRNGRVLRIELEAKNFPRDFPSDQVESAVDYQYVRLGGAQEFLLPVHAENLSCQRNSMLCSKNAIDFRNYHKYTGESNIQFGDVK